MKNFTPAELDRLWLEANVKAQREVIKRYHEHGPAQYDERNALAMKYYRQMVGEVHD